jgi:hypothetical protein
LKIFYHTTTFPPPLKSQYHSYGSNTYSLSVAILPFALRNFEAKIRHKEKQTKSCVKEEGKEEDDPIFEYNGFFQDNDNYLQPCSHG